MTVDMIVLTVLTVLNAVLSLGIFINVSEVHRFLEEKMPRRRKKVKSEEAHDAE